MSSVTTLRLGGVPEHFNLPIHHAIEDGSFAGRGVDLKWTTFTGGTGQMTAALRSGEVDACILLTEGIIADIVAGNPSQIVSVYVTTPLTWGIHTGHENALRHHDDAYTRRYAISRFGSGSHLMPIVDAATRGLTIERSQFNVIGNLPGALESLTALQTDVFYWEKFTTKPYVDGGQLRRIGEFVTPWPCFVVACTNEVLARAPQAIIRMLRTIHDSCDRFMESATAIDEVARRYELQLADVERWYHGTEWATHGWVSDKMLRSVVYNLRQAGILTPDTTVPELVWKR